MSRRPPFKRRARKPTRTSNLRFLMIVAATAMTAFAVTLAWPFGRESETPVVPTAALQTVPSRATLSCPVASITDGDTLRCRDGTRIRLHAVAARETDETCSPGHPCPEATAAAATRELRRLAAGRTLQCEPTGRSYDRVTAICWTPQGVEINCAMVRSGTTLVWPRFDRQAPLCRA